ncbi:hypothetical protein [Flavobacterium xanthum]|uniref:Uncharacterized protein n=1 Tax=Flavobacterium xanthum TaxID=69322 RepID=A0A1M6WY05_9FLAO|nr:hypothetical protein [Flavobacterium xanthum]SHK98597.1 hypothetical protein SAMN05443669_100173 [Flavobacterium xanthum]
MKKNYFLALFTILLLNQFSFAQSKESLKNAQKYLDSKGEVIIRFKANNQSQFLELNQILSISHQHVDQAKLEVQAYANKEQFQKFLTYGITYQVLKTDNEIPQEFTARISDVKRPNAAWDNSWDAYKAKKFQLN